MEIENLSPVSSLNFNIVNLNKNYLNYMQIMMKSNISRTTQVTSQVRGFTTI